MASIPEAKYLRLRLNGRRVVDERYVSEDGVERRDVSPFYWHELFVSTYFDEMIEHEEGAGIFDKMSEVERRKCFEDPIYRKEKLGF